MSHDAHAGLWIASSLQPPSVENRDGWGNRGWVTESDRSAESDLSQPTIYVEFHAGNVGRVL
jgi:hypothetical protein